MLLLQAASTETVRTIGDGDTSCLRACVTLAHVGHCRLTSGGSAELSNNKLFLTSRVTSFCFSNTGFGAFFLLFSTKPSLVNNLAFYAHLTSTVILGRQSLVMHVVVVCVCVCVCVCVRARARALMCTPACGEVQVNVNFDTM